ncbi:hypothetical protein Lesp02_14680 [Lentzea sp. NBRC 105346]|uniref:hypothetical protein n=1 Tax=Lentzea sp. NBRC 105346 TaxID=3032205 RepID=UPI0024A4D105|nr:hypothetical protein [Lentzea sp. NBRC 105346]GLZ29278.1 hypothetical protein Lesp02_14680 [Lentzea sp. NBRC 105346]
MRRPLIAIPARISATASALRHHADMTTRALAQAVHALEKYTELKTTWVAL